VQARTEAAATGDKPESFLPRLRHQQLFFYGLTALWDRRPKRIATKYGRRGRPRRPDPAPAPPPSLCWLQPALFTVHPDFARWQMSTALPQEDNPWLAWGRHTAHRLGEARGWPRQTRLNVDHALVMLLSRHADGDVIPYTEIVPVLRARGLSTVRTTEVLDRIGVFLDDRPAPFELWLERKLDGLTAGIRLDVEGWARTLHDGGPRSRARHHATVWNYLNRIRPALSDWSNSYDHLREVTRDDVITHLDAVHGSPRRHTIIALRSLFRWAKKNGTNYKNPTIRIHVGEHEEGVIQPLEPERINDSVAAVTHPADRLILALAAVHAARPGVMRRLQLDDLDIGNRRLTIDGRTRRLDSLTLQLATEWLEFRRRRWPDTANPHLLVNKQTALGTGPISKSSVAGPALHGQAATLERLRVDRQLEEALVRGPDPLHLAEVFGLSEKTAIRYANSARALLHQAAEQPLQ
jgi:integrase